MNLKLLLRNYNQYLLDLKNRDSIKKMEMQLTLDLDTK